MIALIPNGILNIYWWGRVGQIFKCLKCFWEVMLVRKLKKSDTFLIYNNIVLLDDQIIEFLLLL